LDLTAVILTKNEGQNIAACLASIKGFAQRVVVVDCGSTDKTVELAKMYGADVYHNKFEYFAKQFNWALDNTNITTKWILRLDADERFTPELCREAGMLMAKHAEDNVNGLTMEAKLYFLGKELKHGITKKRKLMIFKRGIGRIEDRKRDAHTLLSYGKSVAVKEKFIHDDFRNLTDFISKYNFYSVREAQDYLEYKRNGMIHPIADPQIQKQRRRKFGIYYKTPKFIRAWLWYVYNFYFKFGFLDGVEGYIFHYFECYWYRYLVDAKIYEYEIKGVKMDELKALGE